MNLQPMSPSPLTAAGKPFDVVCIACGKWTPSPDALCDLDDSFGSLYCPTCATKERASVKPE